MGHSWLTPRGLTGLSCSSAVKNPPAMQELQEMQVRSLGGEDPLEEAWQPTPVFLLENPMDRGAGWVQSIGS